VLTFYAFLAVLVLISRTQPGYRIFRSILSVIPPFSGLLRKMSLARFSRLFAAMYGAGVQVLTGLDIAGETLMESDLQRGLQHIRTKINQGETLADSIASSGVFPHSLRGMVKTGEKAGNIEDILNKLAEYYEIEIDTQSSMLTSVFAVLVLVVVLGTLAIFIIHAWGNYFSFIDTFINE
jgi:type IV pilus assembly protein PilC